MFASHLRSPGNQVSLKRLDLADTPALQDLLERCADFSWLVEGQPPFPQAAEEQLADLPPGKGLEDKYIYGIYTENTLVGVLDAIRGYPQEGVWWIGLLLLDPAQRGRGTGEQALHIFVDWAGQQGAGTFMLGVVEENQRGLQFWQRMGFELVETRPPRLFGRKEQVVLVMRKDILPPPPPRARASRNHRPA
jgi:RimJ/RimL family protein N-acetyltransferase